MFTKRYSYFPKVHCCLCSEYQKYEWRNYINFGWAVCNDVRMLGLEEYYIYKDIIPQTPKYDIGVYSSGWWARIDGIYQSTDIESIKNGNFVNNKIYKSFLALLDVLTILKINYGYSVIVYPHPYERRLYKEYSVEIPYMKILKEKGFYFDQNNEINSISKIYECKLGISMGSTITADRWNLGLDALSYQPEGLDEIMSLNYMGPYKEKFIENKDDFLTMIPKILK